LRSLARHTNDLLPSFALASLAPPAPTSNPAPPLPAPGYRLSEEEKQRVDEWGLEGIWSRRLKAGRLEYEVKKRNVREKDNKYYTKDELLEMGFDRTLKQADEKIAAVDAGLDLRPTTTSEVSASEREEGAAASAKKS
jgi:hypothetical protein